MVSLVSVNRTILPVFVSVTQLSIGVLLSWKTESLKEE